MRPTATTALIAIASLEDAPRLAARLVERLGRPEAIEFVESAGLELVAEHLDTHPPLAGTAMLLCRWDRSVAAALEEFVASAAEVRGLLAAEDAAGGAELWRWRTEVERAGVAEGRLARVCLRCRPADVAPLVAGARRAATARALVVAYGDLLEASVVLDLLGPERGDLALAGEIAAAASESGATVSVVAILATTD